jgi:glucose/arabinose dehydrogenase/PKD repeat protein
VLAEASGGGEAYHAAMRLPRCGWAAALGCLIAVACGRPPLDAPVTPPLRARSLTVLPGFTEKIVFAGMTAPTALRFAPDGRVFVAEKGGVIKVFASLTATAPTVLADLSTEVYDYWDRGLLDIALDPDYPAQPYLYALYTLDGRVGDSVAAGTVPRYRDTCGSPQAGGCVVGGRLVRLTLQGDAAAVAASETVLVENWGQEFPSHSIGSLAFGPDGMLYVSGGEGASFDQVDYGNLTSNPLREPPDPVGFQETAPTAMGGALRAQVVSSPDPKVFPTWFSGKVIRLDPRAEPLLDPMAVPAPPPVVASGLRNPFRMTFRPGTRQLWIADVGWNDWEEIDRIPDATATAVTNLGWPCYEGNDPQPGYQAAGLDLCSALYGSPAAHTAPFFTYRHASTVVPGDGCGTGGAAVTGVAFRGKGAYPAELDGALFFADYARGCIWVMPAGPEGEPDARRASAFVVSGGLPVQLQAGPEQDLYYVDLGGTVRRVEYSSGNHPPRAVATATPALGPLPLAVAFDGSGSVDPDGEPLSYAWDLDGDGAFDDGDAATARFSYATAGAVTARLRVTDPRGASTTAEVVVRPAETAPVPVIDQPTGGGWTVGDAIVFSGHATDGEDGPLPPGALAWTVILHHCPSDCHQHVLQRFAGSGGRIIAPSHDYPAHLEVVLTATDGAGVSGSASLILEPATATVTVDSSPPGLTLALAGRSGPAPLSATVIVGATTSVSAPSQVQGATAYRFVGWSDGGAQSHPVEGSTQPARYVARFEPLALDEVEQAAGRPIALWPMPDGSGSRNLATIRDGVHPPVGSNDSSLQFDSYHGPNQDSDDWIGYELDGQRTFARLVMQEGMHFVDGGWFESLTVEVRRAGIWVPVSGLRSTPPYGGNNGVSYETFTLDFEPATGDGIRVRGRPGGSAHFISVAELQVFAGPPPAGVDQPPVARAGADVNADAGALVTLDGSASSDPDGDTVRYQWTQTGGPAVALAGAAGAGPTFTAPRVGLPTPLTFRLTASDGSMTSDPDEVVVTVLPAPGPDVTAAGRIIASVTAPTGAGSRNLEVIRDGDRPPSGTADSQRQYDTFVAGAAATEAWIGYELPQVHTFSRLLFQEGMSFFDGGWFDSLEVQVRRSGQWLSAGALRVSPAYPGNDGVGYQSFQLDFEQTSGDAIRIFGRPGGGAHFISVAELEVHGTALSGPGAGPDLSSEGKPIARVTAPTGSGSRDLDVLRDGDLPPVGAVANQRQYDTYNGGGGAARDWLGYQFPSSRTFSRIVFQEGMSFSDGGWFDGLSVQVRRGPFWLDVGGVTVAPAYGGNDGVSFDTYRLDFPAVSGSAIRIIGPPGGGAHFVSAAELRVYGPPP